MSNDITTESVRLAMHIAQLKAEVAGTNISHGGVPGAKAVRLDADFSAALLSAAVSARDSTHLVNMIRKVNDENANFTMNSTDEPINQDEQIAALSSANLEYTALVDTLNRRFGLMRLAISGKG